ncbi:MAG: cytochrome c-type biogenesis protein CcmH [Anaerolineae bacterium]|nr:cytochrome c-type biogenesis protein CcmH [Anaerolineae bacterium]
MKVWVYLGLGLLLALLLPGAVLAQRSVGDVTADEVNAVARDLFCPTCESTPLDVCPTQTCQDWRDLIRQQLAEGKSKPEILDYFAANFGPQVLSEPPRQGFNLTVWVVPVVLLLLGGGIFSFSLYRLKQAGTALPAPAATQSPPPKTNTTLDPYREQIERELGVGE